MGSGCTGIEDHEDMNRDSLELDVGTKIHYKIHIYLKQDLPHAHQSNFKVTFSDPQTSPQSCQECHHTIKIKHPPIDTKISVPRIPTSYLDFTHIQDANNFGLTYITPLLSSPVIPHHQPKQNQQNNISRPKITTPSSPLRSFPCLVSFTNHSYSRTQHRN
jgi:hypothetical protein